MRLNCRILQEDDYLLGSYVTATFTPPLTGTIIYLFQHIE
jgi:hypothetical protein